MVFTLNGKEYTTKEINFGALTKLEKLGLEIASIKEKPLSAISALVAYHTGLEIDSANAEIEEHLSNGGKFNDLVPLINEFAKSDFFQKLQA